MKRNKAVSILLALCMLLMAIPFSLEAYASEGSGEAAENSRAQEVGQTAGEFVVDQVLEEPIELPEAETSAMVFRLFSARESSVPALKEGNHEKWIDRLADVPEYAEAFCQWLEAEAGKGASGALATAKGEYTGGSSEQMHLAASFTETLDFTFTPGATAEETKTAASSAAGEVIAPYLQTNYEASSSYLYAVYQAFDRDHPEVFWLTGAAMVGYGASYTYSYYENGNGTVTYKQSVYFYLKAPNSGEDDFDIRQSKYQDTAKIQEGITARDAAVTAILDGYTGNDIRYEKVKYLNQWLISHNGYNSDYNSAADKDPWECISALTGRSGINGPVCEGYARAFKVLCDKWEIPCVLVDGYARSSATSSGEAHMWNYVQMENGNWYAVDVTWNDPMISGKESEAETGYEHEDWLLLGSNTVVNEEDNLTFIQSHPVSNQVSSSGIAFTNGPELAAEKYEASSAQVTVMLTSRLNATAESITVADLVGGGKYSVGDIVTVTAPEKQGYRFMGWYSLLADGSDYTGITPLSDNNTYTFTSIENVNLAAVYSRDGKLQLEVVPDGTAVNYSVDGVAQTSAYTGRYDVGTNITLKYTGTSEFYYWKNSSGKIVSKNPEYTFTIVNDARLTPVCKKDSAGSSAMVEFVSGYGQVMQAAVWNSSDSPEAYTLPYGPSKIGCQFKYWSMDGTNETSVAEILTAISGTSQRITVTPVYEAVAVTYKLTVNYVDDTDSVVSSAIEIPQCAAGSMQKLTAPQIEGKKFSHWEDGNGNILSYSEQYFICMSSDLTVKAVYTDAEVDKKPVITLTDKYASVVGGKNKISFVVTRDVPENYTLLEHGVIYSVADLYSGTDADSKMVIGADSVKRYVSETTGNRGTFILNLNVTGDLDKMVYVRGYMVIQDSEGNITTIYSNVSSGNYNSMYH